MCVYRVLGDYLIKGTISGIDHMDTEKFDRLIKKFQEGELTGEQKALEDQWFDALSDSNNAAFTTAHLEHVSHRKKGKLGPQTKKQERRKQYPQWYLYPPQL